jgi:hypothetical protein
MRAGQWWPVVPFALLRNFDHSGIGIISDLSTAEQVYSWLAEESDSAGLEDPYWYLERSEVRISQGTQNPILNLPGEI